MSNKDQIKAVPFRKTSMRLRLSAAKQKTLDLLLPPQCLLSGELVARHGDLSASAWQQLSFIERPFCRDCGTPFQVEMDEVLVCGACAASDTYEDALISSKGLDRVRAAVRYDDLSGRLVLGLKYADRLDTSDALGGLLQRAGNAMLHEKDVLIVPVPLHPGRLRQRRFNQSALLAKSLEKTAARPAILDLLERTRATPQQQGLTAKARERNVSGAFRIADIWKTKLKNRHVILIDDVLTTGSTLKACARTLKRAGASQVSGLVLARVVQDGVGPYNAAKEMLYAASDDLYQTALPLPASGRLVLLKQKGADFTEISAAFDKKKREEMIQRSNGARTYPQIFIGDTHVGGCDELMALEREGKLDPLLAGDAA